jgi:hypothetical protein
MMFCCNAFESNFKMAGTRGFGVFSIQSDKNEAAFIVQNRAMEAGAIAPTTGSPISLISEMYIRFCPWCGKELNQFYGVNPAIMRPDLKLR